MKNNSITNKQRKSGSYTEQRFFSFSSFFFFLSAATFLLAFGRLPKNVPITDVWTEGVCMLFVYTLPYGTQYDHHNNQ